jgi:hypothetical protein
LNTICCVRRRQIMFCVKDRNGGKLNSHLWFFTAFCKLLQVSGAIHMSQTLTARAPHCVTTALWGMM